MAPLEVWELRHREGDGQFLLWVIGLELEITFVTPAGSASSREQLVGREGPGVSGLGRWLPERKQLAGLGFHAEQMTSWDLSPPFH